MRTKQKLELAFSVIFTFLVVLVAPSILRPFSDIGRMIAKPIIYLVLIGIPIIVGKQLKNPTGNLGFQKEHLLKQVFTGIGIFLVVGSIYIIAVFALGDNRNILLETKKEGIAQIIYYITFYMLFVGLGEELLFRGYLIDRFKSLTKSGTWSVVITSLLFGFWHFPGGQDFLQVIIVSFLGAIYGFSMLKLKNCSTLSVGIAHGLHDILIMFLTMILL